MGRTDPIVCVFPEVHSYKLESVEHSPREIVKVSVSIVRIVPSLEAGVTRRTGPTINHKHTVHNLRLLLVFITNKHHAKLSASIKNNAL